MREILFRGKRVDNGEWVYGLVVRIGKETSNIVQKEFEILVPVIAETVSQYTGLTDKNGRKIFEGDICKDRFGEFVVKWDEENSRFLGYYITTERETKINYIGQCDKNGKSVVEVIRNIHDNTELLEV